MPFNTRLGFFKNQSLIHPRLEDYNCGGFALLTFTWVVPYYDELDADDFSLSDMEGDEVLDFLRDCDDSRYYNYDNRSKIIGYLYEYDRDALFKTVIQYDTKFLLHTFPFLKCAETIEDASLPLIAYRLGSMDLYDLDFHFKVEVDGIWYEKQGRMPIQETTQDDWGSREDEVYYTGPIVYFYDTRGII